MEKFLDSAAAKPIGMVEMQYIAESELNQFLEIRAEIFQLIGKADQLAATIRQKISDQVKGN